MSDNTALTYETPPCQVCGHTSLVELDKVAFTQWKAGALIQQAFPWLTADERELLISGTHPACWNKLFSDEDDRGIWTDL